MSSPRSEIEDLLADRPTIKEDLKLILEVDGDEETWDFEDVPVDSGTFGEIVSRGIVEKTDGSFRVADPETISDALGETKPATEVRPEVRRPRISRYVNRVPDVSARSIGPTVAVFVLVLLFRLWPYPSVFRAGDVVLSSNDPYYYLYLVKQTASRASGPFDLAVVSEFQPHVAEGEPLLVTLLWLLAELLGGGQSAVESVLAVYPLFAGLVSGICVYLVAVRVTGDRRVGLASVGLLAVTPAHAFRTGAGFADHHAFDYLWLSLTALALVALQGRDLRKPRTWAWTGALAAGVAGQTLAWEAGPLLLIPVGGYVCLRTISEVRADVSPLEMADATLVGLTVAAVTVAVVHHVTGWHIPPVAYFPVFLLAIIFVMVGLGEVGHRRNVRPGALLAFESVTTLAVVGVAFLLIPSFGDTLFAGIDFLANSRDVVETLSLFSGQLGGLLAPIFLFGFSFILAIPYLLWSSFQAYRGHTPEGLLLVVYGWYFGILTLFQVRFAGELALFLSVFAGVGLVHLGIWVDVLPRPLTFTVDETTAASSEPDGDTRDGVTGERYDRRDILSMGVLVAGVGGAGGIMTPIKHGQVTIADHAYAAAKSMQDYSKARDWDYPENYVLSRWDRNRMYNHFVNGRSRDYRYAQENYAEFLAAATEDEWYKEFSDRVGFVVVDGDPDNEDSIHARLDRYGSRDGDTPGLGHFRTLYEDGSGPVKIFTPVPGVTITGSGSAGEMVEVSTEVRIEGASFTYERGVEVNQFGIYELTVPYPGEYVVGDEPLTVSDREVRNGRTVNRFTERGSAYWSFDEGTGNVAYDRAGGHHLEGVEGMWSDDPEGPSITFGTEHGQLETVTPQLGVAEDESLTVSFFVKGDFSQAQKSYPRLMQYVSNQGLYEMLARTESGDFGFRLYDASEAKARNFGIGRISFEEWTHVAAVLDRTEEELRLYEDGSPVEKRSANEIGVIGRGGVVRIGPKQGEPVTVSIDEFRIHHRVLSDTEIKRSAAERKR